MSSDASGRVVIRATGAAHEAAQVMVRLNVIGVSREAFEAFVRELLEGSEYPLPHFMVAKGELEGAEIRHCRFIIPAAEVNYALLCLRRQAAIEGFSFVDSMNGTV